MISSNKLHNDFEQFVAHLNAQEGEIVFASSLGAEDVVIHHLLAQVKRPVRIITLDTGRVFPEVYSLIPKLEEKYNQKIEIVFPERSDVDEFVGKYGINGFYHSVEARKGCCQARKIKPLRRALAGAGAWVTGVRREQNDHRSTIEMKEDDTVFGLTKFNPLINWSQDDVWDFIRAQGIPYNPMHDRGFPSIGCQPCTRAVGEDEDPRAGRWWWECRNSGKAECGLHWNPETGKAEATCKDRPHAAAAKKEEKPSLTKLQPVHFGAHW